MESREPLASSLLEIFIFGMFGAEVETGSARYCLQLLACTSRLAARGCQLPPEIGEFRTVSIFRRALAGRE